MKPWFKKIVVGVVMIGMAVVILLNFLGPIMDWKNYVGTFIAFVAFCLTLVFSYGMILVGGLFIIEGVKLNPVNVDFKNPFIWVRDKVYTPLKNWTDKD